MAKILRRGDIESDDEYMSAEEAPQIEAVAPQIETVAPVIPIKTKAVKAAAKMPKTHVCPHYGENFARSTSITKHINELRCPVILNE